MNYQLDTVEARLASLKAAMLNLEEAITDLTTQTDQTEENK